MGNATSHVLGQSIASCGCMNSVGFERSAEAVIRSGDIQPWPAKALIRERLETQATLARESALRTIPVQDGFEHFSSHIGRFTGLTRDDFIATAKNLIENRHAGHQANKSATQEEVNTLEAVFDSMDYDENEELTVGEWAGGLTVFFKGTQDEKTTALFQLLDRDGSGSLSKGEMKEYLSPLVKAMTPPEAAALRPLLLAHANDTIFEQVDLNHDGKCDTSEFLAWRADHNVVDELVNVIEAEVYKIWLDYNMKHPGTHADKDSSPQHSDQTRNSIYG